MSVWYQIEITAMGDRLAIAKLLNLDLKYVRVECTELSFGQKNGPGIDLVKLAEQNPDLVFLVKCSIECDTVQWWLTRFDKLNSIHQFIMVEDHGPFNNEMNKKILEEYTKEFPTLRSKHFANQEGFEGFRWAMFFNDFSKVAALLDKADQYKDMICRSRIENIDFDNSELIEE